MQALILRYSNAEVRTIAAHDAIVKKYGTVWWGWWKKEHEAFRSDALTQFTKLLEKGPVNVALVNRKGEEELFVAECVDCRFGDGDPIASPDAALTPKYYSAEMLPAWFKFRTFKSLERDQFERQFGAVPDLDATFYESKWDASSASFTVVPAAHWDLSPFQAKKGDAILHLSDLHFGLDHAYPTEMPPKGFGPTRLPLHQIIVSTVKQNNLNIAALVVSGDLITRGNANDYVYATHFLEKLLADLSLDKRQCILVPGNHDFWLADKDHPTRDYAHESAYRSFIRGFYASDISELESIKRIQTASGYDFVFISLNSARIRSDELKNYGYISRHRYEGLLDYLQIIKEEQKTRRRETLTFAVFHHHVIPVSGVEVPKGRDDPVSVILDAGEVIESFCESKIGYVLHGHQHIPFVGSVEKINRGNNSSSPSGHDQPLQVISCGSTGVIKARLPNSVNKNAFGVYSPTERGLEVMFFGFLPDVRPEVIWQGKLPLWDFVNNGRRTGAAAVKSTAAKPATRKFSAKSNAPQKAKRVRKRRV